MHEAASKTTKELFKKYLNNIFIETGTYYGDSVQKAIDAGFKTIYSIELGDALYNKCKDRFKGIDNVYLYNGDSGKVLSEILSYISESVTFWLDSHFSGVDTVMGESITPLLKELEIIKNHPVKDHIILIDDLRGWDKHVCGFDTLDLMKKITEINPNYVFKLEDGYIKNDILVACVNRIK
jgi:hypothetical protein